MSDTLLQKVLTLVLLTETGPELFVATMTIFLSDYYDALEEIITHMKSLKLKIYPGENIKNCCSEILVERAESFNPEHLGYITRIFEDTSDSILRMWAIQK